MEIDELRVSELICNGVVIDVEEKCQKNPLYELTVEDLKAWIELNGEFPNNALVVMRTGYGSKIHDYNEYLNLEVKDDLLSNKKYPGFSPELASYLIKNFPVLAIGIDTPSLDYALTTEFPVHKVFLGNGKFQIENMNLEELKNVPKCKFIVAPLLIEGALECTARVYAVLPWLLFIFCNCVIKFLFTNNNDI